MSAARQKGRLTRWNDERGFGFIGPVDGGHDLFVHISAFKKSGRRPILGNLISYEVHTDTIGKQRAVNASIEGVASVWRGQRKRRPGAAPRTSGIFGKILALGLVIGMGSILYHAVNDSRGPTSEPGHSPSVSNRKAATGSSYSCQGKTYCSQMTSCDEAKFYLRNCPGTKMDGDGDGVPCEGQWCGW